MKNLGFSGNIYAVNSIHELVVQNCYFEFETSNIIDVINQK